MGLLSKSGYRFSTTLPYCDNQVRTVSPTDLVPIIACDSRGRALILINKKVLQTAKPLLIPTRGSVVEKCSPAVPRALKKFKKLQEFYQNEENKKPIHLKGGLKDQILYRLTMLLCMVALGLQSYHFYHMAKPSG